MSKAEPLVRIPVGIVVERRKATTAWADFIWRPLAALPGLPETRPWTPLSGNTELTTFYAGPAEIALYPSDAGLYRDNLVSGAPALWVVLRPTGVDPPYDILLVTADPSEGEASTESGADLVDRVAMPEQIRLAIETFVAEHHVEQSFYKRERKRADPDALGRQVPLAKGGNR